MNFEENQTRIPIGQLWQSTQESRQVRFYLFQSVCWSFLIKIKIIKNIFYFFWSNVTQWMQKNWIIQLSYSDVLYLDWLCLECIEGKHSFTSEIKGIATNWNYRLASSIVFIIINTEILQDKVYDFTRNKGTVFNVLVLCQDYHLNQEVLWKEGMKKQNKNEKTSQKLNQIAFKFICFMMFYYTHEPLEIRRIIIQKHFQ